MSAQSIDCAILHTDGGSRNNPGESGIGFTISVDNGRQLETICTGGAYIGVATNSVAEYRAMIWGLQNARALGVRKLEVRADSEFLIKQILGEYRVKSEGIKPLYAEAMQLLGRFESYNAEHVLRALNAAADELANQAMDTRGSVGNYAVPYESNELFGFGGLEAEADTDTVEAGSVEVGSAEAGTAEVDTAEAGSVKSESIITENIAGAGKKEESNMGTYTLWIKGHFDAAHALVGYPGECRNLHGHTWDVEVSVVGTKLDEVGIVYDFKDLKSNLMSILDKYDHKYLNEVAPFDTINATAENLARIIYEQMEALLPAHVSLVEIAVWESPIAKLTYRK